MPYMQAHRVLFEGTRAVGVAAEQLGEVKEFRAEREVIVSGGAYNSPQLLMLSGIGPAEHLTMREIEVLLDQPLVGENLIDHPAVSTVFTTPEPVSLLQALEPAALRAVPDRPDGPVRVEPRRGGRLRARDAAARRRTSSSTRCRCRSSTRARPTRPSTACGSSPCLLQPESRGSVTLAGNDPSAKPIIRHNYYAAERDMQVQMEGMRLLLEITRQPALEPYCATPFTVPADEDEDALREHIARHTTTLYHPVGTCAMGGVVDAELRVNGVEGLRVVDASVMPMVPRGNTNAPTIAVAERAADLIRGRVAEQAAEVAAPA